MRRREFITLLGGAAVAWPVGAQAQQSERIRRIGVLMGAAATGPNVTLLASFSRRLEELGWANNRNIRTDVRWWSAEPEQVRTSVQGLLALSPDVIMAFTNLAVETLKSPAGNIPIVFVAVGEPVASGYVASLAHPGGNITGFASYETSMGSKWLEVLKETAPRLTSVLVLMHPEAPIHQAFWLSIKEAAARLQVEVSSAGIRDSAEIQRVVSSFGATTNGGLIVLPHAITQTYHGLIITLELRIPADDTSTCSRAAASLIESQKAW